MGLYGNRRKKGYRDTSSYEQGAERYHSGFYHQYFEGYTEVKVASDHGKSKIERIYTGKYYMQNMTAVSGRLLKLFYGLGFLASACMFFLGAGKDTSKFLAMVSCAVVILLIVDCMTIFHYITAKPLMKIYEYRSSSVALIRRSGISAAAIAGYTFCKLIVDFLSANKGISSVLNYGYLVCSVLFFAGVAFYEAKVVSYKTVENELSGKIDGIEIGIE